MKPLMLILVLLSIGLLTGYADTPKQPEAKSTAKNGEQADAEFQKMDANADGKVTPEEFKLYGRTKFGYYDTNVDEKLNLEEYLAGVEKEFEAMDTDSNGVMSPEELMRYHIGTTTDIHASKATAVNDLPGFDALDIDHSGAITISDYYAYVTQQSFGASDATQTTLWSHDDVKAQARENFRSMDLDNDGIVTKQEYVFLSVGLPLRKGRK